MIRTVHPFPARMAPELALQALGDLAPGSTILDPMAGSGTVLRQAVAHGHQARGFDLDPLAVLMSKVWTTPVSAGILDQLAATVQERTGQAVLDDALPWIDDDPATAEFTEFWFGEKQRRVLRRYASVLYDIGQAELSDERRAALNVLRLNLSRIIVTKEQRASLARDTSHSRPHRVTEQSDFDVQLGFERSLKDLRKRLLDDPVSQGSTVGFGDARNLVDVQSGSIDAVITSPPYLNAIDYLRGHRMSLVWLGHRVSELRTIRSTSIGAERKPDKSTGLYAGIAEAMTREELPRRHKSMIERYAEDLHLLAKEMARVLKPNGKATLVVGNSCLKGIFIRNSDGVVAAARALGFHLESEVERDLPMSSRYLPMSAGALGKRMRTETVLTLRAPLTAH